MIKMPSNLFKISLSLFIGIYVYSLLSYPVYSDEISDLEQQIIDNNKQLEQKKGTLSQIEKKIAEISGSNYSLSQKINLINQEIQKLEESIEKTETDLNQKIKDIEEKQSALNKIKDALDKISSKLYMESRYRISNFFFSKEGWDSLVEGIYVKKNTIGILRDELEKVNGEFSSLAESKTLLENDKVSLETEKGDLDKSYKLLADEKAKLQKELNSQYASKNNLSADITDLSKKVSQLQQMLIAFRSGGFVSSGGTTSSDSSTSISSAPLGYFGVFSIGAYTHRNGMSQWGALARADAGQNYQQLLSAYYSGKHVATNTVNINGTNQNIMTNITTTTYGTMNFEDDYLMRLGEMPESWAKTSDPVLNQKRMEAFKAQVIIARTYAINYTQNGSKSICTSASCQVIGSTKKTGPWKTAVEQTRGMVLLDSSNHVFSSQYAAVHGGWVNGVGWDTQSGNGLNWFNNSWERLSGVTWFYKSWYRAGDKPDGTTCGHTPWLAPTEMQDILNAYLIKTGSGLKSTPDLSRLLPSDFGKCSGRPDYGRTDKVPYSSSELKNLLNSPVTSISSVRTSLSNGNTSSVIFSTNRGDMVISGMEFKTIYNQMAAGYLRIQQQDSYAYFNVEKR